ncbi:MAG: Rieske (2Fe-2S) protein, partial [Pseudomonadota bacterium]|nr:Rieske (2Fe-2S) protein [Pseudomonadota bacterium]
MVETRRNDLMLAPWTYNSEELCELEIDHIFRHQWILAGHISELAQAGDYLTFDLAKERAVLVRDESGEIHAFHNVCRHRGSRVAPDRQGNCGHVLRCPFHGWTYELNGMLKSVPRPQGFPDLKKNSNALVPIDLEIWNGFIFICFEGAQGRSV